MRNISYTKNIKDSILTLILSSRIILEQTDELSTCADRICEQCGNDHDFRSSLDDVKTSIDVIPELCQKLKIWESTIRSGP
jgi:hypothetical protein